ncbi:hypothetical protein BH09BAC3_BH09BAC3_07930 [soil metagenome]
MKRSILFLVQILLVILFACHPRQSTEQQSSDSTSVTKDTSEDSLRLSQESPQHGDTRGNAATDDPDASDEGDDRRDGMDANVSHYRFLGFSEDLNYAGFAIGWRADRGPDVTSKLYIVNVDKNDFVSKPVTVEATAAAVDEVVRNVLKKGAGELSNYRISGTNIGTSCYVDSESNADIPFDNKIYKLKLIQKSDPNANKFFELQVLTDGEPIILQSESSVPKARGNVVSYKVVAVFVLEDKVAVIVEYNSPDIKDYERHLYHISRQVIVTGSLLQKLE